MGKKRSKHPHAYLLCIKMYYLSFWSKDAYHILSKILSNVFTVLSNLSHF